jgi:hypothetical protein
MTSLLTGWMGLFSFSLAHKKNYFHLPVTFRIALRLTLKITQSAFN